MLGCVQKRPLYPWKQTFSEAAELVRYVPIADAVHQRGRAELAAHKWQLLTSLLILEIVRFLDDALAVF